MAHLEIADEIWQMLERYRYPVIIPHGIRQFHESMAMHDRHHRDLTPDLNPYLEVDVTSLAQVLLADRWWRCPPCGHLADAHTDDSTAVLYARHGSIGARGSETSDSLGCPGTWTIDWWRLRRHHRGCVTDTIYDLTPDIARRPVDDPRRYPPAPVPAPAREPARDWTWTCVLPASNDLPVVVWQPQLGNRAVHVTENREFVADDRLDELQHLGARLIPPRWQQMDAITGVAPDRWWRCNLTGPDTVTITRTAASRDTSRPAFTVTATADSAWIQAAAAGRVLFVAVPAGTLDTALNADEVWSHPTLQTALNGPPVGVFRPLLEISAPAVMMTAAGTPQWPLPAPPPARPRIDVTDLWTAARRHAHTILTTAGLDDTGDERRQPHPDIVNTLADVLTAQAREQRCEPADINLFRTAQLLTSPWERQPYLYAVLHTSNAAELRAASSGSCAQFSGAQPAEELAAEAVRSYLLSVYDGPRVGDTVLLLPPDPDLANLGVRASTINSADPASWRGAPRDPANPGIMFYVDNPYFPGQPQIDIDILITGPPDARTRQLEIRSALWTLGVLAAGTGQRWTHDDDAWLRCRAGAHTDTTVKATLHTVLDIALPEVLPRPTAAIATAIATLTAYRETRQPRYTHEPGTDHNADAAG